MYKAAFILIFLHFTTSLSDIHYVWTPLCGAFAKLVKWIYLLSFGSFIQLTAEERLRIIQLRLTRFNLVLISSANIFPLCSDQLICIVRILGIMITGLVLEDYDLSITHAFDIEIMILSHHTQAGCASFCWHCGIKQRWYNLSVSEAHTMILSDWFVRKTMEYLPISVCDSHFIVAVSSAPWK